MSHGEAIKGIKYSYLSLSTHQHGKLKMDTKFRYGHFLKICMIGLLVHITGLKV